jgi:hypothetical protein
MIPDGMSSAELLLAPAVVCFLEGLRSVFAMKQPPRPRQIARPALQPGLPPTVKSNREKGERRRAAKPATKPARRRGLLAVASDIVAGIAQTIPQAATLIPEAVIPAVSLATLKVAGATAGLGAMTLRGDYWEISYQQRSGVILDYRGLRYIALLLRDTGPGREPIHAKELAARATGEPSAAIELERDDDVLDPKAKKELLTRLEEIAFERDRAASVEDFTRAERLEDEYEQIADELSRAGSTRGAGGRKATFVHAGEKARKAVAKAIATAIGKIAEHPDLSSLAEHLTSSLRKGQWLSYNGSTDWRIDFSAPPLRK